MSFARSVSLVLLGVLIGVGLTFGTFFGIREYAPEYLPKIATFFLGSSMFEDGSTDGSQGRLVPDSKMIGSIVQEILASPQGEAIIRDLINGQTRDTFLLLFQEAMKSPEFRKALSESLESFLKSPEGKELIKRIAKDALTP